eukprot:UN32301
MCISNFTINAFFNIIYITIALQKSIYITVCQKNISVSLVIRCRRSMVDILLDTTVVESQPCFKTGVKKEEPFGIQ